MSQRERLSRCPTTPCNSTHSRTTNIWEEPLLEGHPTTGWEPVSPSRFRTGSSRGESIVVSAGARRGVVSASDLRHHNTMRDTPKTEQQPMSDDAGGQNETYCDLTTTTKPRSSKSHGPFVEFSERSVLSRAGVMNRRDRKPRVVHPGPPSKTKGGPPKTARRDRDFCLVVRRSTPILYCCDSRQKRKQKENCLIQYRYEIGVDRRTTPAFSRRRTGIFLVHPENRRVDRVDHPLKGVPL